MAGEYVLSVALKVKNVGSANADVESFASKMASINGVAMGIGAGLLVAAAAVAGFTALSVQKAMDYETAMTQLKGTTGATSDQMRLYAQTIRNVSDTTGAAQTDLAKGMYQIVSANFAGADASRILTTATQAATIAGADQSTVTTGLVVSLNAFTMKADQADTVSNQMFKTLALGRGNMTDLAGALQTGAALVHHYNVSYTDMDATLATLSTGGMKTFGTSMTGLTGLLNVMDGKTDMITKRIHKLGLPFDEAKFKTMGFEQQVAYLNKTLANNKGQTVAILGSKQAAVALGILGDQSKLLASNTKKLSDSQELAKEKAQAWADKQKDTAFQMQKLQTNVSNLMIDLGTQLLPVINQLVTTMGPLIMQFVSWLTKSGILQAAMGGLVTGITTVVSWITRFTDFLNHNEAAMTTFKIVAIALGGVLGGIVVAALVSMTIAAWAALVPFLVFAAPFIAVGAVIALVIAGIVLLVQHWGDIMDFMGNKAELTRIKVAEEHVKMALITDQKTAEGATKAIANMEKERVGILQKLKETHDPAKRAELMHQLGMLDVQEQAQKTKLKKAEEDKQKQLAKQKQLHAEQLEAQKNWFQRMLDGIGGWITDQMTKLALMASGWILKLEDLRKKAIKKVEDMVMGFINKLEDMRSRAIQKATDIKNGIQKFFTDLPGEALKWGENLIQQFINGIQNMIGKAGQAASDIVNKVKGFLGFHSPADEGPGADADQWAPNLMKMYAQGIQGGTPGIQVAVKNAVQLMHDGFSADASTLFQQINAAQQKALSASNALSYDKYQDAKEKAYDKWSQEKHHKKPFHYADYKAPTNQALSLGAFANSTSFFDSALGNGTPVAPFGSAGGGGGSSTTTVIQITANDAADVAKKVQAIQNQQYRMSGQITPMASGGNAR